MRIRETREITRLRKNDIGSPDEEGNVYAMDYLGKPYIAYNVFGTGNRRLSMTNPMAEARAHVFNTGGKIISSLEGKKLLRDYYKMMGLAE